MDRAALAIVSAVSFGNKPRSRLAMAHAHFTRPRLRTNSGGSGIPLTGKLSTARWVLAPHRASAGTSMGPIESFSTRVATFGVAMAGGIAFRGGTGGRVKGFGAAT